MNLFTCGVMLMATSLVLSDETRVIPPIDAAATLKTETATFALG